MPLHRCSEALELVENYGRYVFVIKMLDVLSTDKSYLRRPVTEKVRALNQDLITIGIAV